MNQITIGILGGSGLYDMEGLKNIKEIKISTPLGDPSDSILFGEIDGISVAFLARHGRNHSLLPSEVPYRANILALKKLGVKYLLSLSAVGSLREHIRPRDIVIPDQYIDFTKKRYCTFFGEGSVAHISMAEPGCGNLRARLVRAAKSCVEDGTQEINIHQDGTYVCIEGPQFSSQAESHWYRSIGADLVGMTNMPEAKLAKEAQIAYASLAMVTDYDCWHPHESFVTADAAMANLKQNANLAQVIARKTIQLISSENPVSTSHSALKQALVTPIESLDEKRKNIVEILMR